MYSRAESAFEAAKDTERIGKGVTKGGVSPANFLRLGNERNTVVANAVFIVAKAAAEGLAVLQDNSQITCGTDRRQMRLVFVGCGHSQNQCGAKDRERLHGVG
jgi:hypothetical protein